MKKDRSVIVVAGTNRENRWESQKAISDRRGNCPNSTLTQMGKAKVKGGRTETGSVNMGFEAEP